MIPTRFDFATIALARQLEPLSANAWPALQRRWLDGWLLGNSGGITDRANSALPLGDGGTLGLDARLDVVEAAYRAWHLPVRVKLSPASAEALDALLVERYGDWLKGPVLVQTAALTDVLARTQPPPAPYQVAVRPRLGEDWHAAYAHSEGHSGRSRRIRAEIMRRIALPTGYALAVADGQIVAVGLGVVEDNWLGIFCMTTLAGHRRNGLARGLLHALANWAAPLGATRAWLQVNHDNEAAQALYGGSGFATQYPYWYRGEATVQTTAC